MMQDFKIERGTMCCVKGCARRAAHQLGVSAYAEGHENVERARLEVWSGLAVCEAHLNDGELVPWWSIGFEQIREAVRSAGRVPPAVSSAKTISRAIG